MIANLKKLGACCFALALALPAAAGSTEDFKVEFNYNPYASEAETYDGFKRTARRACISETHGLRGVFRTQLQKQCEAELMDRVVMKTKMPSLIALHEAETGRTLDAVSLAKRNAEPSSSATRQ
ncbi:MAG: hypothetical protein AAF950_09150 [Pseudomonadota bacterium]